jgi:hypothetical protein
MTGNKASFGRLFLALSGERDGKRRIRKDYQSAVFPFQAESKAAFLSTLRDPA